MCRPLAFPLPTWTGRSISTSASSDSRSDATCRLQAAGRWVEVAPAGGIVTVALVGPGSAGVRFATRDAESDHAGLRTRGVEVGDLLRWPGVPTMYDFADPDGNRCFVLQA